jgi:hypothetical protein
MFLRKLGLSELHGVNNPYFDKDSEGSNPVLLSAGTRALSLRQ